MQNAPTFNLTHFKDKETVEDVRHLLTNVVLRDVYDKQGTFMTQDQFKDAGGQIPINMRYLQAVGSAA
jgi:hypothetical protein